MWVCVSSWWRRARPFGSMGREGAWVLGECIPAARACAGAPHGGVSRHSEQEHERMSFVRGCLGGREQGSRLEGRGRQRP